MKALIAMLAAGGLLAAACTPMPEKPTKDAMTTTVSTGPFAAPSTLPYGLPPFDKISDADFRPGFEAGMREQREEIDAIAHNSEKTYCNPTGGLEEELGAPHCFCFIFIVSNFSGE